MIDMKMKYQATIFGNFNDIELQHLITSKRS